MSTSVTAAATEAVRICASDELVDGGAGVRRAARFGGGDVVVFLSATMAGHTAI